MREPDPRIFLCSSSTPPGGGVHGMCGYPCGALCTAARLRQTDRGDDALPESPLDA